MADARIRRGYTGHKERQLHYRIAGKTLPGNGCPPLLMLHPTPKSGWIYEKMMRLLSNGGRIIVAPDTPGYGASDPLEEGASIEGFAEGNFALVDELVARCELLAGPFDILGYHTGSVTAAAMALARPKRVRRIVLCSIPTYDVGERAAKLAGLANWPKPVEDGSHLQRMWDLVGSLCDERVSTVWRNRSVTENLRAIDASAGYRAVYRYDLIDASPRVIQPVLLMNAHDDLFEITRKWRQLFPNADYRELSGMAHGMFEVDAEAIAALVAEFLHRPI